MAEAVALVGLLASIAQLVSYGSSIVDRVVDYQKTVRGAPKVFKGIETNLPLILVH